MLNILKKIPASDLTGTERHLMQIINSNAEKIPNYSIYELSKLSNVSTSSIVRFCKKIGMDGFQDFKIQLSRTVEAKYKNISNIDHNIPFHPNDSEKTVASKIAVLTTEAVLNTQELLTNCLLSQSIDMISDARRLIGVGVSGCFNQLLDFQTKIQRIGIPILLSPLQAEQFYLAEHATFEDVAIIVSYSGETAEIVNEADIFAKNGTKIIAITSNPTSKLGKKADLILEIPGLEKNKMKITELSSHISIGYILNSLYACIYNRNFDTNYSNRKHTPISIFTF